MVYSPDIPNIASLLNTLFVIKYHWYIIGTRLNISEDVLKDMWEEASSTNASSKEVFCCCKMLMHWYKQGSDLSVENFLKAIDFAPLGLGEKIPFIKGILLDEVTDETALSSSSGDLDETEKCYASMIAEVTKVISKSDISLSMFKLHLDHCKNARTNERKIEKKVYEKASNFSDLIDTLQSKQYITHTELSWLKYLVDDVANNLEALNVINKYEQKSIAHMICWKKELSFQGNFLVAKMNKHPASLTGNDVSRAKAAISKSFGHENTDMLFDSAGVGSVIIYWKVTNNILIELPDALSPFLMKACNEAGITHIGTVIDKLETLIEIQQLTIDNDTSKPTH